MSYPENVMSQMAKLVALETIINNTWIVLEKLKDHQALENVGISACEDILILQWPRIGTFCAIHDNKAIIHLVESDTYNVSHKEYDLNDNFLLIDLKYNLLKLQF